MIKEVSNAKHVTRHDASHSSGLIDGQIADLSAVRLDLEVWKHRLCHLFELKLPPTEIVIEGGTTILESRYRFEFGASGWKNEVVFHEQRIAREWGSPLYCFTIGDLAHILFHVHDNVVGNPIGCNDHNPAFISHAAGFGLIVDDDGVTRYATNSAFTQLLEANRVSTYALFDLESYIAREAETSFARQCV